MAISEIVERGIEQTCEVCGTSRTIDDEALSVGVQGDGAIIPLPPCESCGAVEYLVRSSVKDREHPSQGSFGHRHQLMVDVLHSRLLKRGRVAKGIDNDMAKGRERTPEELERWFKGKLRLRREQEASAQPTPNIAPMDPQQ